MRLTAAVARLQRAQISVQAMTRLASVLVFLIASWTTHSDLALVAIQGTLLTIPYALQESLLGRPLARGVVPQRWDHTTWAARATLIATLAVAPVAVLVPVIAVPGAGWSQWIMAAVPVLLQMPVEGLYWLLNKRHSSSCGNLVQQAAAAGTIGGAGTLAVLGHSLLLAAVPAQLLVIAWAVRHLRGEHGPGTERPGPVAALRPGLSYSLVAVVSLAFAVALPTLAGAYVGAAAIVVIRALDLSFGPFHLLLTASVREDVLRGRPSGLTSAAKLVTIGALVVTTVVLVALPAVRRLISDDLGAASRATIAAYGVYKAFFMINTWQASRHMLRSSPGRFMTTGIVSSGLALAAVGGGGLLAHGLFSYLLVLCVSELLLIGWFGLRNATDPLIRPLTPTATTGMSLP